MYISVGLLEHTVTMHHKYQRWSFGMFLILGKHLVIGHYTFRISLLTNDLALFNTVMLFEITLRFHCVYPTLAVRQGSYLLTFWKYPFFVRSQAVVLSSTCLLAILTIIK